MAIKKSELYNALWESCDELRGGMDASQYKDYVLVLLFVKYVSDRAGSPDSQIVVPQGGGFSNLVALKGKDNIGEGMNKVLGTLATVNHLNGVIDVADFNDTSKLGTGQEMKDRLSNLIGIFQDSGLDFSGNRADGDDLLGDAYEYLMRNFATESGKAKGQFYTPAEVSRIMASVIGASNAKSAKETIYDPTCGSGSLLLKAHDAARAATGFDLAIYGQEMDIATAGLARMNMLIHDAAGAEIKNGNTLSKPEFEDPSTGGLKTFDYIVANPPFSTKSWTTGVNVGSDPYGRFRLGTPPKKNGDYAFLLHVLTSLKSTGRAAIILPHGVLFRGGQEEVIRRQLIKSGFIEGIIGLPGNLFYGTGIPACIIVLDKAGAAERTGIFMIDAQRGFAKDGAKNRLRERDIHMIVDTYLAKREIERYARLVPITKIAKKPNDYNLNLPRYIDTALPEYRHDIDGHLRGGIPVRDIDALDAFWKVFVSARAELFTALREGYVEMAVAPQAVTGIITRSDEHAALAQRLQDSLGPWLTTAEQTLRGVNADTKPKALVAELSEQLLQVASGVDLVDAYGIYQDFMTFWEETMRDDLYLAVESGWLKAAELAALPAKKKGAKRTGRVDFTVKKIDYRSELIPAELLRQAFFAERSRQVETALAETAERLDEITAEYADDEDLPGEAYTAKGAFTKTTLAKALKLKNLEPETRAQLEEIQAVVLAHVAASDAADQLEEDVRTRYATLTEDEVIDLVVRSKWLAMVDTAATAELEKVVGGFTARLTELASRYENNFDTVRLASASSLARVEEHLRALDPEWS